MSSSLRRSSRRLQTLKSKCKSYNENNNVDPLEESGSDFEDEIKKNKEIREISSSSEEEEPSPEESVTKAKRSKLSLSKARKSNATSSSKAKTSVPPRSNLMTRILPRREENQLPIRAKPPAFLSSVSRLSLSDSSSDEAEEVTHSKTAEPPEPKKVTECKLLTPKKVEKEELSQLSTATSQLDALAVNWSQNQQLWTHKSPEHAPEEILQPVPECSPTKFAREIAEALAMGEKRETPSETEEEEDPICPEKSVPGTEPGKLEGNIEVTLEISGRKGTRNKKAFDLDAYVKREISKAKREFQLVLHQCHIVCLVAHLRYLNNQLESPLLKAVGLSVTPSAHICSEKSISVIKITQLLSWFQSVFRNFSGRQIDQFPSSLQSHLLERFEKRSASSNEDLLLLFLLIIRAMGIRARIVLNLNTVPLKPEKSTNAEPVPSLAEKSEGTAKSKCKSGKSQTKPGKSSSPEILSKSKKISIKSEKNQTKTEQSPSTSEKSSKLGEKAKKSLSFKKDTDKCSRSSRKDECKEESSPYFAKISKKGKASTPDQVKRSSRRKSGDPISSLKSSNASKESKIDDTKTAPKRKLRQSGRTSKKSKYNEETSSDSEADEVKSKSGSRKRSKKKTCQVVLSPSAKKEAESRTKEAKRRSRVYPGSSGEEFEIMHPKENKEGKKQTKKDNDIRFLVGHNYWVEVLVKKEWVCVDVVKGKVGCAKEMESGASKPMLYVLGCNEDGTVKDVTRRYAKDFHEKVRKLRVDQNWFESTLAPFKPGDTEIDRVEEKQLTKTMENAPMPTTVSGFKNHPLYVLPRHLLKFEGIYPPDAPTLGFLRSEAIYARECVHTLHCRTTWLKEGRIVKLNEEAYKVVKARPKWDRMSGSLIKDQPLDLFGKWQTEIYIPPPAKDGKVPRNEYGNVELFKPWMLPKGTVHLQIPGLNRIARKLNIDCAAAMMGWDFHSGTCHPVMDGFVVCEEFQDVLLDAWNRDIDEKAKKEETKREKRVLDNWKKISQGNDYRP